MTDAEIKELRYWVEMAPGAFSVTQLTRDVQQQLDYLEALEIMVEDGQVNRHGNKRGWYIPANLDMKEMDYVNADDEPLDIWLPFGLDKKVELYQDSVVIIAGAPNAGKALCNKTPVLTPNGWKNIGTLTRNDQVYGKDGGVIDITGVYPQGVRSCYRFTFNDGSWIDSDEEHIWTLKTTYQLHKRTTGHGNKNDQFGKWINLTTKEIVKKYGTGRITQKTPRFPINNPVSFPKKKVPVNPYILGSLIGDGSLCRGMVTISTADKEMIDTFTCAGYKLRYGGQYDYRVLGMAKQLRPLGIMGKHSWNKFIPNQYLFNNVKTRLALLKGLMDTDGSIDRSGMSIEYCSVSKQLAMDVQFLVRSLGGRATLKESESFFTYKGKKKQGRNRFRVAIKINMIIFSLKRKRERQTYQNKKTNAKKLFNIQKIEDRPTTCIKVAASDGLFIAKDFIVTHNTSIMLNMVKENMGRFNVNYFNSEMSAGELKVRLNKFDYIDIDQWDFNAYARASDFHDVIKPGPENLNIIDFLECHDEFFRMGKMIKDIHDKLNGAVAIIAIQKNPNVDTGLGGFRSLEVTRLALAIDYGTVKIVKAKNFNDENGNPNGLIANFKILHGSQLMQTDDWRRDDRRRDQGR